MTQQQSMAKADHEYIAKVLAKKKKVLIRIEQRSDHVPDLKVHFRIELAPDMWSTSGKLNESGERDYAPRRSSPGPGSYSFPTTTIPSPSHSTALPLLPVTGATTAPSTSSSRRASLHESNAHNGSQYPPEDKRMQFPSYPFPTGHN
ncbi:5347_t:CDS:2 [Acaulospora colombiana]|uniref:5347_t:CDS:1 n=1 Tax=Acaulospora colombiana TaxID=27376 RepID=A0ACA9MTI7_9GLOM|nr:5347_t:CDS:2 [Acaulospora colombiana]